MSESGLFIHNVFSINIQSAFHKTLSNKTARYFQRPIAKLFTKLSGILVGDNVIFWQKWAYGANREKIHVSFIKKPHMLPFARPEPSENAPESGRQNL